MILEVAAATGSVWALRRVAHHAILRGLRAIFLRHRDLHEFLGLGEGRRRDFRADGRSRTERGRSARSGLGRHLLVSGSRDLCVGGRGGAQY